jgi:hypothetical protein
MTEKALSYMSAIFGLLQTLNIPAPKGAFQVDRLPPRGKFKGIQIREPGTTGNASTMRIMAKNWNQNERVTYYNAHNQPLDPKTGLPGDPASTHIPFTYRGPWKGLPKWWTDG